jgi:hypothetical protein
MIAFIQESSGNVLGVQTGGKLTANDAVSAQIADRGMDWLRA